MLEEGAPLAAAWQRVGRCAQNTAQHPGAEARRSWGKGSAPTLSSDSGVKEDPEGVDRGRQVTGPPLPSLPEKPLAMSVTWWLACPCRLWPLSRCVM